MTFWDGTRWASESSTPAPTPTRAQAPTPAPAPARRPRGVRRLPFLATAIGALLIVPALAFGTSNVLDDPGLAASGPTVTVTGIGSPGELVVIDGRGFRAHQVYQVQWDSLAGAVRLIWPDVRGTFHGHLRIPRKAVDGRHSASFSPVARSRAIRVRAGTLEMSTLVPGTSVLRLSVDVKKGNRGGGSGPKSGPTISAVSASNISQTGALVSWTLNEPATGQVEYGPTIAYGLLTTPELSYDYSAHKQQVSGLAAGTLYHYRVKSQDAAGHLSISSDFTFTTLGVTATPTPAPSAAPTTAPTATPTVAPTSAPTATPTATPTSAPTATPTSAPTATPTSAPTATPAPGVTGIYGSGLNFDTKANLQVGWTDQARLAHRFVASTSSTLQSIRFQQRGGPIYSGGSGGKLRITVQTDANGVPSGTVLGTGTYAPASNSGAWTTYDMVTFSSPASLTKGIRYYIVFENVDADPVTNYFSINELYVYGSTLTPRQPAFADADYAVLYATPSTWSVQGKYTADMDLTYANGAHDGMAYIQNMTTYYGTITGSASVREHFTVNGASRTVTTASVRVRRTSGSSALTIRLESSSGALIEAVDVPAGSVPASAAGGDNGGSVWVTVTFASPHDLAAGSAYNLRLTTASDTTYTAAPIREGTDVGLQSFAFRDGSGQGSANGTSWSDLYAYSPVDLQFYFR